jgi:FKBP-type peptidyl-prolyl cis-trans isomerase FkpA
MGIAAVAVYAEPVVDTASSKQTTAVDETSYAFGVALGSQFLGSGIVFKYDDFAKGFRDSIEGASTLSEDEALTLANAAYRAALAGKAEENKIKETAFFVANAKEEGIVTEESGLQYRVITEGTGAKPLITDTVQVHYKGSLLDGTEFDSSYNRGEPTEFALYEVIDGWAEGLQLMSVGSKYELFIPSDLAYGENGASSVIPPYSPLIFEVELLAIIDVEETETTADEEIPTDDEAWVDSGTDSEQQ